MPFRRFGSRKTCKPAAFKANRIDSRMFIGIETQIFSNCTCMPSWSSVESLVNGSQVGGDSFTSGYCPSDCYGVFIIYVAVMGGVKFLLASARLGGMLTGFRCVDPEDKSFAIGLGSFFISLFAWIPGPIVYGAIIGESTSSSSSFHAFP